MSVFDGLALGDRVRPGERLGQPAQGAVARRDGGRGGLDPGPLQAPCRQQRGHVAGGRGAQPHAHADAAEELRELRAAAAGERQPERVRAHQGHAAAGGVVQAPELLQRGGRKVLRLVHDQQASGAAHALDRGVLQIGRAARDRAQLHGVGRRSQAARHRALAARGGGQPDIRARAGVAARRYGLAQPGRPVDDGHVARQVGVGQRRQRPARQPRVDPGRRLRQRRAQLAPLGERLQPGPGARLDAVGVALVGAAQPLAQRGPGNADLVGGGGLREAPARDLGADSLDRS